MRTETQKGQQNMRHAAAPLPGSLRRSHWWWAVVLYAALGLLGGCGTADRSLSASTTPHPVWTVTGGLPDPLPTASQPAPATVPIAISTLSPAHTRIPSPTPTSVSTSIVAPGWQVLLVSPVRHLQSQRPIGDLGPFDWTPDGQTLAFTDGSQGFLFLARAPTFTPEPLLSPRAYLPRWSLDGMEIAFLSPQESAPWADSIGVIRADDSQVRDLLPGEQAHRATGLGDRKFLSDWLDERTLAFLECSGSGGCGLATIDVSTRALQRLPVGGYELVWSPDRHKVLTSGGGGRPEVHLGWWDGTTWQTRALPLAAEFPAWTPDGRAFSFSHWDWKPGQGAPYALSDHVPDLYLWALTQEDPEQIVPGGYGGIWSPTGQYLAFFFPGTPQYDEQGYLSGTDLTPGRPFNLYLGIWGRTTREVETWTQITQGMRWSSEAWQAAHAWFERRRPAWSPNGQQVIYWGPGDDLWITCADGTNRYQLTAGLDVEQAAWSPDGTKLALATSNHLWIVGRPTGTGPATADYLIPTPLARSTSPSNTPSAVTRSPTWKSASDGDSTPGSR